MKTKGCIFDLDGVIVNTAKYHFLAWRRLALEELGFEFKKEDNERLKGVSRMRSLDILLEIGKRNVSKEEKIRLANKKNKWYVEYISKMDKSEILPGVENFLKVLKNSGIKIALGSASKNSMTILKRLELGHYFDDIVDGNKVSKAKPDPEVFLLAASNIHLLPEECVVFEDSKSGIQAARNAHMHSIGVGSPEVLTEADKVINGFLKISIEDINF